MVPKKSGRKLEWLLLVRRCEVKRKTLILDHILGGQFNKNKYFLILHGTKKVQAVKTAVFLFLQKCCNILTLATKSLKLWDKNNSFYGTFLQKYCFKNTSNCYCCRSNIWKLFMMHMQCIIIFSENIVIFQKSLQTFLHPLSPKKGLPFVKRGQRHENE